MNLHTILSVLTAILLGHFTFLSSSASTNSMKVASTLNSVFSDDATAKRNIIVTFNKSASNVNNMFDTSAVKTQADFNSLHEKYVAELQLMSRESQEPIMEFLKSKKNKMESYWITNQVYIKDASKELVDALTSFGNVKEIREEKIYHIAQPIHEGEVIQGREGGTLNVLETSSNGKIKNVEWNIAKIKADQMWTAAAGETCVVGVIDTGVKADHEAFHKGMVKAWKDAVNNKKIPYDDNGHGTHVTGTIAGKNGIGVAPGVSTVHCKACTSSGSCPESALTSCCQFMTEQKPNIVSNSWGGPSGTADYEPVIEGWKALGIFSVFAAGNEGPACKTVGSPADYGNIGCSVGATTDADGLADFSSRGECMNGNVAPTVSAPGKSILSAWIDSNTAYKKLSGTSMATPHVAGMYALLHSKNSKITFEQARSAIIHSCQTSSLQDPQLTCGSTSFKQIPNNMYGNGRIDCANALEILSKVDATGQMMA